MTGWAADTTLPNGGQVSSGAASIAQSAAAMTVTQSSQRAAINWQGFSIGKDASVTFVQPNANAVILNRVTGGQQSVIDGALHANGQVFLLNPNGVLFSSSARVDTAGLVATTRSISDADFMAGKTSFSGTSTGDVVNAGILNVTDGGYVALIGRQVRNDGVINARLGTVALASGDRVSLNFDGNALVGVTIDQGTLNALVHNGGAVLADGGTVLLKASAADSLLNTVVNNTGQVRAQSIGERNGKIVLLGEGGAVEVAGTLDASNTGQGNGGFIETSGPVVQIKDGTAVTTAATQGASGTWLIDPTDFTIAAGAAAQSASGIGATTLQTALTNGNVIIQTQAAGSEAGDINVNAGVAWNANKLTLEAHGDINVNAVMSATGSATLDLKTGYNFNSGAPVFDTSKNLLMGMDGSGNFKGRIDFDRVGTGLLTINNRNYTLINALGSAGSTTGADLQGINDSDSYALASNIDAAATSGWNSGSGFTPLSSTATGVIEGLGHTVSNLTINQPTGSYVGLIGINNGMLRNIAVTNAAVSANQGVGVLAGLNSGRVLNSYGSGSVSAPGGYAGGLIGAIFDGYADKLHFSGSVSSGGANTGGLTGYLAYQITLSNSYASGTVTAANSAIWTGGLVGQNDYGLIVNSHSSANVSGGQDTGGLVGNNNSGVISGSYATGTVTGTSNTGGLAGNNNNGRVTGSYATGAVSGTDNVGGLIGYSVAFGGTATPDNTVSLSYATGSVTGSGDSIGGLVGKNYGNDINNSYARGAVTGFNYVGGLVGNNLGTMSYTYATGLVTANGSYGGGLVGVSIGGVSNSFWDIQTTGQNSSMDGIGKTTAQMKTDALYTGDGWDFTFHSGVWGRKDSLNDGYPVLRTFGYTDPITITLNNAALSKTYGDVNPLLGASGWTVSGCDNNLTCLASVDWGTALTAATAAGSYSYSAPNVLAITLGAGYGKLSDYIITINPGAITVNNAVPVVPVVPAVVPAVTTHAVAQPSASVIAQAQRTEVSTSSEALREDVSGRSASAALAGNRAAANLATGMQGPDAGFAPGTALDLVFSPVGGETATAMTLAQAGRLVALASTDDGRPRDMRVPVSADSLTSIVNGGVRLPDNVDQLLFAVKKK